MAKKKTEELTEDNYFSNDIAKKYMSVSQLKMFKGTPFRPKCESRAMSILNGEYSEDKSDALLIGSYVDIALTGTEEDMQKFIADNPEMISTRGATKGMLKSQFVQAQVMVDRVKADEFMMATLEGNKQEIITGEIYGVPFRAKIDVLNLEKGFITDLKTCKSIVDSYYDPIENRRVSFIAFQDYVTQGAIYQELVRQKYGKTLPFFLTCVSKEKVPDIAVIQIDNETLYERLVDLQDDIMAADLLKKGKAKPVPCNCCDYCKSKKKINAPINWLEIGAD